MDSIFLFLSFLFPVKARVEKWTIYKKNSVKTKLKNEVQFLMHITAKQVPILHRFAYRYRNWAPSLTSGHSC